MKKTNLDNPLLTITLFVSFLVIVSSLVVFFAYERFLPTPVEEPTAVQSLCVLSLSFMACAVPHCVKTLYSRMMYKGKQ